MNSSPHYGFFDPAKSTERLSLNREEALSYLGYKGQAMDASLRLRFEELADACECETRPQYAWARFAIDDDRCVWEGEACAVALVGSNLTLPGHDICSHLKGADSVVLLVCTLGLANEQTIRRQTALSAADGTMYSACSSALVEACANAVEEIIRPIAAKDGLYLKWRYSPGYGDLPLSVQPDFLSALKAQQKLGISVTPSYLLVPTKTITAVIGLFDTPQPTSYIDDTCDNCQVREVCSLRKAGRSCRG